MTWGDALAKLIKDSGLTMTEFCRASGIEKEHLWRVSNNLGAARPNLTWTEQITKAFDVTFIMTTNNGVTNMEFKWNEEKT